MGALRGYVAVHSQGLGHATRAVALARDLQKARPDLELLFLAGVPALDLVVASGFDAMPLPPAPDWPLRDGALGPVRSWYVDYARYLRVARRFLRKEGDWGSVRFLVSDGELASVVEAVRRRIPTALVLNTVRHAFARDLPSRILEAAGNAWFARLARQVDLVLVADEAPPWPNVRRIGPVVRAFGASREKVREDLVFLKRTILVTPGGTAIGEALVRASIRAFRELDLPDASMVVVTGPKLRVEPAPGVYVYGFVPNLQDYVLAADLVITTAGKGTLGEALAAGTPVLAIPPAGHVEAEANARALGFAPGDLHRLRELIPQALAEGRRPPQTPGNAEALAHLLGFLGSPGLGR
ncbi:MAG: hypothetical protein A3K59_00545 [Euryarchaeota archaeon RBG_19FT_COMBO_69_17]|nr:MAG: hypothetical protein A3K59_00545 [Euryarchaeota archaeon RBG_19FT_COMBO_69_17]